MKELNHFKRYWFVLLAFAINGSWGLYKLIAPEKAQFGEDILLTTIISLVVITQSLLINVFENRFLRYMEKCLYEKSSVKKLIRWTHKNQARLNVFDFIWMLAWIPFVFIQDQRVKEIVFRTSFFVVFLRCVYHGVVIQLVYTRYIRDVTTVARSVPNRLLDSRSKKTLNSLENLDPKTQRQLKSITARKRASIINMVASGTVFLLPAVADYGYLIWSLLSAYFQIIRLKQKQIWILLQLLRKE